MIGTRRKNAARSDIIGCEATKVDELSTTRRLGGLSPKKIAVLLFSGFSNLCLANALEPFRAANAMLGRDAYDWRILTLDGAEAISSSGIRISPSGALDKGESGDFLLVMPGYGVRDLADATARSALRAAATRFDTIIGLDAGSWLLAAAGLLDGCAATIHFDEFAAFELAFPDVEARRERWIVDGDRLSAAGAAPSFELMLQLIEQEHGPTLTLDVAALFLSRDVGDRGAGRESGRRRGDPKVAAALDIMTDNIETPLDMPSLARRVGCTERGLSQRFARALGVEPSKIYRRLRLNHARRLLETTELGVMEIAIRCGYQDASAFARAFKAQFGQPPTTLRH